MDYIDLFRPVFSYALHLARANPNRNRWASDPDAVKNDLASLIASIRPDASSGADVNFDQAWYAVSSWLGETLVDVPGGRLVADALLPPLDPDGSEFYRRLNALLTPGDDGRVRPEILDIIKVYGLCLELDYRGYYSRPGYEHQRQAYRRRCRQVAEAELGPPEAEAGDGTDPVLRAVAKKAAMWVLPLAGTLILYGIYRTILNDLYASVVG